MKRLRTPGLAACLVLLALAGCGGGSDKEEAEKVVRDVAEATSESDGEKSCSLVTKKLLEQLTGTKGDKAKGDCEKLVDSSKSRKIEIAKITRTEIKGDKATVTALVESQGRKRPQVFNLKKEDGDFRLAGARE